jgi:hypothetical protein
MNPRGTVYTSGLIKLLAKRFAFEVVPKRMDTTEEGEDGKGKKEKGIVFESGYFDGQAISNLTLYSDGIKIDLLSSTDDGKRMLLEALHWLRDEMGLTFSDAMIKRWGFLSNLVFQSEFDLDTINPALKRLSESVSELVQARLGVGELEYRPSSVRLNFERVNLDRQLAEFIIERRGRTPFSEKKYYSSAPLETSDHIRLLENFENDLRTI